MRVNIKASLVAQSRQYSNGDEHRRYWDHSENYFRRNRSGEYDALNVYQNHEREWNSMQFITIHIQADFNDEEADQAMIDAAREAAKVLRAQATIMSGKRAPTIKLTAWKMYEEEREIPIDVDTP